MLEQIRFGFSPGLAPYWSARLMYRDTLAWTHLHTPRTAVPGLAVATHVVLGWADCLSRLRESGRRGTQPPPLLGSFLLTRGEASHTVAVVVSGWPACIWRAAVHVNVAHGFVPTW